METRNKRVDVMVDLEALSMEDGGSLLQLCAKDFDIRTGEVRDTFNMYVNIKNGKEDLNVSGNTLIWWLEDSRRYTELDNIIRKGKETNSEEYVIKEFHNWLSKLGDKENVYFWGNGILDDNRYLAYKYKEYGLEDPIKYSNHRDVRTLTEMACIKNGISDYTFKGDVTKLHRKKKGKFKIHNAESDVEFQITMLCEAFKTLRERSLLF